VNDRSTAYAAIVIEGHVGIKGRVIAHLTAVADDHTRMKRDAVSDPGIAPYRHPRMNRRIKANPGAFAYAKVVADPSRDVRRRVKQVERAGESQFGIGDYEQVFLRRLYAGPNDDGSGFRVREGGQQFGVRGKSHIAFLGEMKRRGAVDDGVGVSDQFRFRVPG
jgi:hypothetical protein